MDKSANKTPHLKIVELSSNETRISEVYRIGHVGNCQGSCVSGGNSCGRVSKFQRCDKVNGYLSCRRKWWGGWPTPSHRLRASAQSLLWPGMWDTSTSIHELDMRRLSFSKNSAIGIDVEKSLLEVASAVVLSDKVGIRIGILEPGKIVWWYTPMQSVQGSPG